MIAGTVSPQLDALIPLRVVGPAGTVASVSAVVDTGFSDSLTLPPSVIAALGLAWVRVTAVGLADGSVVQVPIYQAEVLWHGVVRAVQAQELDGPPLLGMGLLADSTLFIDCQPGGRVEITPRPPPPPAPGPRPAAAGAGPAARPG